MNIEELIADLRARINPQYYDQIGTESYERHQVVKALESLMARIDVLREENNRLHEENERLRENAKIISELEQLAARSNNDLLVENERLKPLSSWHPMRTAPRDGTKIVVLGNNYGDKEQGTHICIASCIDGLFYHENDDIGMNVDSGFFLEHLTHWMPLPEPPK